MGKQSMGAKRPYQKEQGMVRNDSFNWGAAMIALIAAGYMWSNTDNFMAGLLIALAIFMVVSTSALHSLTTLAITVVREGSRVLIARYRASERMYAEHQRTERERAKYAVRGALEQARLNQVYLRNERQMMQARLRAEQKMIAQQPAEWNVTDYDEDIDAEYELVNG